ncbi:hypothetical protein ACQCN2_15315 [Brevibacillus ginsengisoli]|uniref:hypothetical protein n=1 Tax=Brevibacillus ginsengisoli TaxID=363854 RepID=UPI003CED2DD5
MGKKNVKLRIAWMIPNVFLYLGLLVVGYFVITNLTELSESNRLGIWMITLIAVLVVALFGSYKIVSWIRQGKM